MSFIDQAKTLIQSSLLHKQSSSVVGIDIGSSAIKVVQVRKDKGIAVLETYGEIALGPSAGVEVGQATNLPPEKLAESLKEVLKDANITSTSCGASIPFASSLVKLIEMPVLPAQKLAEMIPLEARKYIPVPLTEVQIDWFIIPEAEQKFFENAGNVAEAESQQLSKKLVLLVAIHNESLRRYTEALKLAGLTPSFYEIEVFSSIRSTIERGLAPVAIIDIGAATSKVYVVELGIILASHVISKGSQDVTQALANSSHVSLGRAEEIKRQSGIISGVAPDSQAAAVSHAATLTMEHIMIEARRVLLGFQKKHNKVLSKVVLTGGGATMKGLREFAQKELELEVELANPFSHVQAPAFLENVLKEAGPDFAVAMGLVLRKLQEIP